jgi:C1A family cysteine protease
VAVVRKWGMKPSKPDPRDFKMKFSAPILWPAFTENRKYCSPVKDQGEEGSCTAHAGTSNWEMEFFKFFGQRLTFSRQFLYWQERYLEGTLPDDAGAEPRSICKVITKYGLCLEGDDPYDISKQAATPTSEQYQKALAYRSGAYHRLETLNDIKGCLTDLPGFPGHPFMVGFSVFPSFMDDSVARTGLMPMPKSPEAALGGHEVLAVDFDDRIVCPGTSMSGAVLMENSWGTSWGVDPGVGSRGFFWMPYEFILNPAYASDLWILHYGKPW